MPCGTVRLCGISSRFQLLSPCVRQVTHALLTRPPLSHFQKQAFKSASFDLHVLSTPPAFILSQDQTLVKSVCPVQNNSGHLLNLWIVFAIRFTVFGNLHFWRCSLKIYKKFSGMVYDSVFNVLLIVIIFDWWPVHHRVLFFLLLSATFISYHRFKCLSTTFLFIFFRKFGFFLKSCSLKRQLVYNNT